MKRTATRPRFQDRCRQADALAESRRLRARGRPDGARLTRAPVRGLRRAGRLPADKGRERNSGLDPTLGGAAEVLAHLSGARLARCDHGTTARGDERQRAHSRWFSARPLDERLFARRRTIAGGKKGRSGETDKEGEQGCAALALRRAGARCLSSPRAEPVGTAAEGRA